MKEAKTKIIPIYKAPVGWKEDPNYVYIGRSNFREKLRDEWGNPIVKGEKCRVCDKVHIEDGSTLVCYEAALLHSLRDSAFEEKVRNLHGKTLVCYCADPNKCHGSILAKYARLLNTSKPCECCGVEMPAILRVNLCSSCSRDYYNMG